VKLAAESDLVWKKHVIIYHVTGFFGFDVLNPVNGTIVVRLWCGCGLRLRTFGVFV
jgi:hypothetical protein